MPPLLADFSHARACKPFCEKYLTLPGRLNRFLYMSDACRKATITRWRAEVKPLVSQASEHPETFDPEAFDKELCAIFDTIRLKERAAEHIK